MKKQLNNISISSCLSLPFLLSSCSRAADKLHAPEGEYPAEYGNAADMFDRIYYGAIADIDEHASGMLSGSGDMRGAFNTVIYIYDTIASLAPLLIAFSWVICALLCFLFSRNKSAKKASIAFFGIFFPAVLIIFVFAVGGSSIFLPQ